MLDEDAYHSAREELARLPCPFEKAILSRCAACELARVSQVAEREVVACTAAPAWQNCLTLRGLLHQNAAFALHLTDSVGPLPHAKEMKIQCGGLLGMQRLSTPEGSIAENIHDSVRAAQARFGDMEAIPYQEVVKAIAAFEGRRRR